MVDKLRVSCAHGEILIAVCVACYRISMMRDGSCPLRIYLPSQDYITA